MVLKEPIFSPLSAFLTFKHINCLKVMLKSFLLWSCLNLNVNKPSLPIHPGLTEVRGASGFGKL